jgi:pyrimidine operon attenuation protein / uracil phosphoribosyltransferase
VSTARQKKYEQLTEKSELLGESGVQKALESIAEGIVRQHGTLDNLILVGVRTGGVPLAQRLRKIIKQKTDREVDIGEMDISLYRDDVFSGLKLPKVGTTSLPQSLEGKVVILIDDVLYTGRTIRAALVELLDFGRPERVQLAVLVDRGHRELPIQPDYVGLAVTTTRQETVRVMLRELKEQDRVVLCERASR